MSLTAVITLSVSAPAQARFGKHALLDFTLSAQPEFCFKNLYFASQAFRNSPGKLFGPKRVRCFHVLAPRIKNPPPAWLAVGMYADI